MNELTAADLATGAYTASRIADIVSRAVAPSGVARDRGVFRTRERSQSERSKVAYFIGQEDFVCAARAARGLDPFCPYSDPESDVFAASIEAARYVLALRRQSRELKVAALAICRDPSELLLGPLGVDHAACIETAREALEQIGHPRAVWVR